MRLSLRVCVPFLLAALGGCQALGITRPEPQEVVLADDGKALMPIVIALNAGASTKAVAEELGQYLTRITGAKFEVVRGGSSNGIVLGTLADFPAENHGRTAGALKIRGAFDGKEAYVIRSEPGRLLLLGATELGASHAASRFLEELGCRWFFPAPEWEVVPSRRTLAVKLDIEDRPVLLGRRIWYGWGFFEYPRAKSTGDYAAWARRNRMTSSLQVNCGHAWENIIYQNKALFDAHPEYLALVTVRDAKTGKSEQKRQGEKFCISNPAIPELCKKYALDFFAKNPDADMVSIECSDGGGHCECAECAKIGSISDTVFYLANEVAKAVNEKYPGKMAGLYAYNQHCEPPSFALEPNVYVQLTAGFITGRYTYDELLEMWPKKCRNMGFYEYFSVYQWDWDMLPGGNGGNVPYIRRKIPLLVAHRATSIDAESGDNWGLHGRGYYLANRLMWNPQADAEAILQDFYEKAFGPGAQAMKRYYERLDPGGEPLMSEHLIGLAFRDVEEASRLAADRPDVLARLDDIKIYLRYFHLKWMLARTTDKDQQKKLEQEIFTHVYRTRYTYMNHWEAIRQYGIPAAAKKYEEPTWATDSPPWKDAQPYTRQEIDAFFGEGLAYFKPQEIAEVAFSQDLVPVQFTEPRQGVNADRGIYQGGVRYALYSVEGEPVTATVTTGCIAWYRDRAPAAYKLLDPKEKVIAEGRLKLDGEKHVLTFNVPRAGLYYLDFNDSSAGWQIEADADRPLSIPLRQGRGVLHHGWNQDMYFYVPAGTRSIQYYWSGGPHNVYGPDGKLARNVADTGKFVTIPVPEGMDGKVWRIGEFALIHLWFFNVPNCVAGTPNALLVPREVALKDGLKVRARKQ